MLKTNGTLLSASKLKKTIPLTKIKYKSSKDVNPLDTIVGQERAINAISLGAKLWAKGYNIFVTGLSGTGRLTTVKNILENETLKDCPVLFDYVYVNNFKDSSKPTIIRLSKGKGSEFQKSFKSIIERLRLDSSTFAEDIEFKEHRNRTLSTIDKLNKSHFKSFDANLKKENLIRYTYQDEAGVLRQEVCFVINEQIIGIDRLDEATFEFKLNPKDTEKLKEIHFAHSINLRNLLSQLNTLARKVLLESEEKDKEILKRIIGSYFKEVASEFTSLTDKNIANDKIASYLDDAKNYLIENLYLFVPPIDPQIHIQNEEINKTEFFNQFEINVIVDNTNTNCAPIIIERIPSYANLFGTFERLVDKQGFFKTDFSKIKVGSLLQADNGYLIVNADDLFNEPGVWQALKRVLLYGKLEIQTLESFYQLSQSHIKPEPVNINVKVIIIGGNTLYNYLSSFEKGFKKIFKVNAQFDYEYDLNDEIIESYIRFISRICNKENLPHLDKSAIRAVIEWAIKESGTQNKITLKFSEVADLIRESSFFCDKTKLISEKDIYKAVASKKNRLDMLDEKINRTIIEGDMLIDTKGKRVGQINGLTVMDTGLYSFGKPARITSLVSYGENGVINVEREAELSGSLHDKAVLIISAFLKNNFGKFKPLSMDISIAFEQNYGGIDGDSATVAEIYTIMSAITNVPLNQEYAITGSMNQKGDVQPIGGVNEKITGFYNICKLRGLTGKQGVVIPEQNVKDLFLDKEIIESVEKDEFRIVSIKRIEEGVNYFFGINYEEYDSSNKLSPKCLKYKLEKSIEIFRKESEKKKNKEK